MDTRNIRRSSSGIFSGFVNWLMHAWNPYSEVDLQHLLRRKIQNNEYGIQIPWKKTAYPDVCHEMMSMVKSISEEIDYPTNDYLQCSDSETYCYNDKNVEICMSDFDKTVEEGLCFKQSDTGVNFDNSRRTSDAEKSGKQTENINDGSEVVKIDQNTSANDDDKETTNSFCIKIGDNNIIQDNEHGIHNIGKELKDKDVDSENDIYQPQKDSHQSMTSYVTYDQHQKEQQKGYSNRQGDNGINSKSEKSFSGIEVNSKDDNIGIKDADNEQKEKSVIPKSSSIEMNDVNMAYCEASSNHDDPVNINRKSVTFVARQHDVPSTSNLNSEKENLQDEELTEKDLAYGQEGFEQYQLFVEIEKRVEIAEINDERNRMRKLYTWRIKKIRDIMRIARVKFDLRFVFNVVQGFPEKKFLRHE